MGRIDTERKRNVSRIVLVVALVVLAYVYFYEHLQSNIFHFVGFITIVVIVWRSLLSIYRRIIVSPANPLHYGKWAIVTGTIKLYFDVSILMYFVKAPQLE